MRLAAILGMGVLVLAGCGSKHKATPSQTPAGGARTSTTTRTTATSSSANQATASGSAAALVTLRPFSSASPWNTPVDTSPVDANSVRYLALVKQRIGTVELGSGQVQQQVTTHPGALWVNTRKWAPPIVDAQGGRSTSFVCRQLPQDCGDVVSTLMLPVDVSPLPQYDGWLTVTDRSRGVAFDFWRARRSRDGGTISYQFARRWDLGGPGFLKPTVVSARGSGLPLFAGVIVPQEVRAGQIDHALAIALPGPAQRNYVQPASRTDGDGPAASLPEGARIRLRSSFQLRRVPDGANRRAAEAIVAALKRYGAIVVDRARVPTLFAQQNFDWTVPADGSPAVATAASTAVVAPDAASPTGLTVTPSAGSGSRLGGAVAAAPIPLLRGDEVQGLAISDFEVVRLPAVLQDPPLDLIQVDDQVITK